ncbi:sugar ABC transporter permease [Spirochaetia bacterium]|nr:sugar ABC transporter permease [Spirochaetia bacterium]
MKKQTTAYRKKVLMSNIQSYSLLLPNLLLFCAFSVFPVFWTLKYIFYRYGGIAGEKPVFIGLQNLARVFRDGQYWQAVSNTFIYAGGKIAFIIPLAFFLALILNKSRRGNGLFQSVIFVPTIMSSAVMGLVFFLLFNTYNGDLNRYLMALHVISQPVNWLGREHAMLTLIIVAVWGGVGNYMVYFIAGLQMIPKEALESAVMDGANRRQTLWNITIPMLGPILKIILMLSIINAFSDMNTVMVLTEGGPINATMVMSLYGYSFFFPVSAAALVSIPQYGYGAAVSLVSALIAGMVTVIYLIVSRRMDKIF